LTAHDDYDAWAGGAGTLFSCPSARPGEGRFDVFRQKRSKPTDPAEAHRPQVTRTARPARIEAAAPTAAKGIRHMSIVRAYHPQYVHHSPS